MRCRSTLIALFATGLLMFGCPSRQQGNIRGAVTPATADVRVTVRTDRDAVVSASPDAQSGSFSIPVAAGTYDVTITSSASPFPVSFAGVVVEAGKEIALGEIQLAAAKGTGAISGRINGGGSPAEVAAVMEGRERASRMTDASGRYALKDLPAGAYIVKVQAPNYAQDSRSVVLGEGQQMIVNMRLLYRTAVDGIDWQRGVVRIRGVGVPPAQAPTPTVRRELARRAALADAERNLLRVMELIETGPGGQKASSLLGQSSYTQTIEGFVKGHRITAERDLEGGNVEVEIELPLTGPGGFSSYLPAD